MKNKWLNYLLEFLKWHIYENYCLDINYKCKRVRHIAWIWYENQLYMNISWFVLLRVDIIRMSHKCSSHQAFFFTNTITSFLHVQLLLFQNLQAHKRSRLFIIEQYKRHAYDLIAVVMQIIWYDDIIMRINSPHVEFWLKW